MYITPKIQLRREEVEWCLSKEIDFFKTPYPRVCILIYCARKPLLERGTFSVPVRLSFADRRFRCFAQGVPYASTRCYTKRCPYSTVWVAVLPLLDTAHRNIRSSTDLFKNFLLILLERR